MHATLFVTVLALAASTPEDEPEWGGFRGNNGGGLAHSAKIPDALSLDHVMWRTELPGGYSSPVVSGDRVFVTGAEANKLWTIGLDRATGEKLWSDAQEFDGARVGMNSSAAPSPITDGERVYVLFHATGLTAYDVDGERVWHRELGDFNIPHGMATSPVLHGDFLIQLVDQDVGSHLVAFDKHTGEVRWKVERPEATHSYSTPAIYAPADGPAQVVVSGAYRITGYAVESGERLWWVTGSAWQTKAIPLFFGDLCIVNAYIVPSSEFGLPKFTQTWAEVLEERDADDDGKIARGEWDHEMMQMIWFIFDLDGDELLDAREWDYVQSTGTATGGLFAIDLTGKGDVTETHVKWEVRRPARAAGLPLAGARRRDRLHGEGGRALHRHRRRLRRGPQAGPRRRAGPVLRVARVRGGQDHHRQPLRPARAGLRAAGVGGAVGREPRGGGLVHARDRGGAGLRALHGGALLLRGRRRVSSGAPRP